MHEALVEYPRTEEFLRYAVANCGTRVVPRGKHAAIIAGATIMLDLIKPPETHYARKTPPIVVSLYAVKACQAEVSPEQEDKIFIGRVIESRHKDIHRGDSVIGLASLGCDTLIVDTSNEEDMEHLLETYADHSYREQLVL